ncbi:MAG TPA: hypothetical protein VHA73_10210 [Acidimicrobiales bacterium]|nr:hypothetical protein [Acidimicrobiales bacterium]
MAALIIVGVVVVVGVIAWLAYQRNKKHREQLAGWAASKGWTYAERDDSYCDRWSGSPFGQGHSRKAKNVMCGTYANRDAVVFDYQYNETTNDSNGTHETTYRFGVYALALPCALPTVSVAPEGFFTKIGHAVGIHDIDLESEDFNRAFRLTADDKKLAYDVLPARNMQLLLSQPDIHVRTQGSYLLAFDRRWLNMTLVERRLAVMGQFVDQIPGFVWDDHGAGSHEGSTR